MIQVGTTLTISDNSGAKKARCIKILKKTKSEIMIKENRKTKINNPLPGSFANV